MLEEVDEGLAVFAVLELAPGRLPYVGGPIGLAEGESKFDVDVFAAHVVLQRVHEHASDGGERPTGLNVSP